MYTSCQQESAEKAPADNFPFPVFHLSNISFRNKSIDGAFKISKLEVYVNKEFFR